MGFVYKCIEELMQRHSSLQPFQEQPKMCFDAGLVLASAQMLDMCLSDRCSHGSFYFTLGSYQGRSESFKIDSSGPKLVLLHFYTKKLLLIGF